MRYKQQIWEYFVKYSDEERFVHFRTNKGSPNTKPFYDMENEQFYRILNTFRWLNRYNSKHIIRMDGSITKPTNEHIVEAMEMIRVDAEHLRDFAKKLKGEVRRDVNQIVKKRFDCIEYYKQLAAEDFFADKC